MRVENEFPTKMAIPSNGGGMNEIRERRRGSLGGHPDECEGCNKGHEEEKKMSLM